MAGDNREIGRFILDGIPVAPRGVPQIEVTFDIDANGIVGVSAKDKATSKEQSIRIEGSGGFSKDEIERMVQEASVHAKEDRERREKVDKHNQLANLVYGAEKTLNENGEKLPSELREATEKVLAEAREDVESEDVARMDAARQRVEQQMHRVAEVLYKSETAGGPAPTGEGAESAGSGDDDEVIDAEYTEEKGGA